MAKGRGPFSCKRIFLLKRKGLRSQKINDKDILHNSESKPGATEEEGGSYQLGLLKRGVKRSVYLLVNQLLNPHSFFPLTQPTSCHVSSVCSFISNLLADFFLFFLDNGIQPSNRVVCGRCIPFSQGTAGVCHHPEI